MNYSGRKCTDMFLRAKHIITIVKMTNTGVNIKLLRDRAITAIIGKLIIIGNISIGEVHRNVKSEMAAISSCPILILMYEKSLNSGNRTNG